ncbi:Fe(3+) ABC transporter substrate-binding protein [Spirulina subsalsa FACHB-351]|uniref:Fe(3+) ABC transporter substrate-binding protein n=1 Tax=Spirulina subsalsa FACHB-351 TaxID=234711 RepID=A0ABT3L2M6_9CYAN|nr:Fe(3+) ABC transporter substrate-binding protein [Spirulina subsalsa]MCW6035758.1 Fe(3+) ABC transporter substrate-binding protein [Spirulina subsalsa FACHB-351]
MNINRRLFLFGGTAITAVVVGNLTPPTLAQTRNINLYSSRHYDTDDELYNAFKAQTGLGVNLIEAEADQLIERVKSEGANSPADVLITVDAGRLWVAEREGLLAPVDSAFLKQQIPANRRHPDGLWFGFSQRARVIFYNRDRVNPADLSTYEDLATPKWAGKILVRSSSNVYNQSLVAGLIAIHGVAKTRQWLRGFVSNFARSPEGNDTAQIRACAAGAGDIAIANSYYYARLAKSNDPVDREVVEKVGIFFPNQRDRGTHMNISGGGVFKTAPNPDAAIKFLEHLAGSLSQIYFAQGNNEYPVVPGTPIDPVVAGFGTFKQDDLNVAEYGKNQAEAVRLMDQARWI